MIFILLCYTICSDQNHAWNVNPLSSPTSDPTISKHFKTAFKIYPNFHFFPHELLLVRPSHRAFFFSFYTFHYSSLFQALYLLSITSLAFWGSNIVLCDICYFVVNWILVFIIILDCDLMLCGTLSQEVPSGRRVITSRDIRFSALTRCFKWISSLGPFLC